MMPAIKILRHELQRVLSLRQPQPHAIPRAEHQSCMKSWHSVCEAEESAPLLLRLPTMLCNRYSRCVLLFSAPRSLRGRFCSSDHRITRSRAITRSSFTYLRNLRQRARHLIFFSHFSQQGPKKTNKTFYTTSPFAYMLYAMELERAPVSCAAFPWNSLM
jgi:hypothetical protein